MRTRLASIVILLIAWSIASTVVGALVLPSPWSVAESFARVAGDGRFASALSTSLYALVVGGGAAIIVGIPLGVLLGARRTLGRAFDFYFSALFVMPFSAVAPLFVLWFGIDAGVRAIFVFFFTLPQVVIICYQGARTTPERLLEVAHAFRATDLQIFRKVIMPFEVPFIFTALRLGLGRAIQGMVVAELLISSTQGIGWLLEGFSGALDIGGVLAIVLFIMLLGVIANAAVQRLEDAVAPWYRALTAVEGEGADA
jgi:ABC-type nitrate/sulfonate/bicarbonate transport system permease component